MKSLYSLVRSFFEICLFTRAPQEIPPSQLLLAICIFTYVTIGVLVSLNIQDLGDAGISVLIDVSLVLFFTYTLLSVRKYPERWLQTSTAILGTGTIFGVLALPFYFVFYLEGIDNSFNFVLSVCILSLLAWNISVMAHILRHALDILFAGGIIISLIYIYIITRIVVTIAPREAL